MRDLSLIWNVIVVIVLALYSIRRTLMQRTTLICQGNIEGKLFDGTAKYGNGCVPFFVFAIYIYNIPGLFFS